jgi:hypothetical protein
MRPVRGLGGGGDGTRRRYATAPFVDDAWDMNSRSSLGLV